MVSLSDSCWRILRVLCAEPWLTPDQLARWLRRSPSRLYGDLQELLRRRFIQRVNPRCVHLDLRALYALTDRGVKQLAAAQGTDEKAYREQFRVSRARHRELLWRIEQVHPVRELLLELPSAGRRLDFVGTLAPEPYAYRGRQQVIQLMGRARMVDEAGNALRIAVEWDNARLQFDRKRLNEFGEWLWQFREWEPERDLPALLYVLASRARLEELWDLLHERRESGMNLHSALLLTTVDRLSECGAGAPIWLSVEKNQYQHFTDNQAWIPQEEIQLRVVRRHAPSRIGKFQRPGKKQEKLSENERLLQFKLSLPVQAKRVLRRVATRPLLSVRQLAWVLQEHPDRVGKALQELRRAGLVRGMRHQRTQRYLLSARGTRFEAAEQGFGRAVKRYLRRTGGRSGVKRLAYHLEHTIACNDFFLAWARLARATKVEFEWLNEIECSRYFQIGSTWHRLLPDGRGVWHGAREPFRFVVELDRTRESAANLSAKFDDYFYWQLWRMSRRGAEPDPNLLVVTTSWPKAGVIAALLERARREIMPGYPLWVTTFELLAERGLDAAIWQSNRSEPGLRCLPCLAESVRTGTAEVLESYRENSLS